MVFKAKLFYLSIIGIIVSVFVFTSFTSAANTLSKDIFPDSLNGIPLTSVEEEMPDDELVEGFSAYYETEDKDISIFFWRGRSEKIVEDAKNGFAFEVSAQFNALFDRVDWNDPENISLKGHDAQILIYKAYLGGDYVEGGIIYLAVKDYFILVQIINFTGKPSVTELTSVMEVIINKVPDEFFPPDDGNGDDDREDDRDRDREETLPEEAECGNNNCEYWLGETCDNCLNDCNYPFKEFCCYTNYSYIYAQDYHNKIYDIRKSEAGLIPSGAIMFPSEKKESDMPLRPPSVCNRGGMRTGECVYNYDCPSGVCTTENWCIRTRAEKMQEIKDPEITKKIYEDQISYKEEYVEAYEMMEGGISQIVIKDAKLDIKLEVQGNTAGRIPKVNEDDEIEVRLEITNDSKYNLALTAGIFYPETFDIEEKKYTISFDWEGGLSSFIGSFKTKLINSKFMVMPSGSKIIVYSKVIPQQTGYLDVQGLVFFTTEKKYQKYDIGLLDEAPKSYQESEVSETILVEERPCNWWPICL